MLLDLILILLQGSQPWHSGGNKQQYWQQLSGQARQHNLTGQAGQLILFSSGQS